MYEPNPKHIQSKEDAEKSKDSLRAAMRKSIERCPQNMDEVVQAMNDLGTVVTRKEALADLGFNEASIQDLIARL